MSGFKQFLAVSGAKCQKRVVEVGPKSWPSFTCLILRDRMPRL
jgi:hypothetical protein